MLEAIELAKDEALESGRWMGGELGDVKMLVPLLLVEPVLDAIVGVDGECDVEEIDGSRELFVRVHLMLSTSISSFRC